MASWAAVVLTLVFACLTNADQIPYPPISPVNGELAQGLSKKPRTPVQPPFNSTAHFQLEMPTQIHTLQRAAAGSNYSHSAPFRVLSEEAVRVWQSLLLQFQGDRMQSERGSDCLRGLVYKSSFVRDLVNDPVLVKFLSDMVGQSLEPFDHTMNQAHVNFGHAGQGSADVWHIDSHPFVLIIMLSDHEDGDGGELMLLPDDIDNDKFQLLHDIEAGVDMRVQKFRIPLGYGILVHGSELPHAVAPLLQGPTRISLTMSYQFADPLIDNANSLRTWRMFDGKIADFEFFRSEAWRSAVRLRKIVSSPIGPGWDDGAVLAEKLRASAWDLMHAADILDNKTVEPQRSVIPTVSTKCRFLSDKSS